MKQNSILVTGGAGYIGSHTTLLLLQEGFDVIVIDNFVNSTRDVIDRIEKICGKRPRFYEADLCDFEHLKNIFQKENTIQSTIHFAALKAVGESVEEPVLYYRNNLISLLNLLDCLNSKSNSSLVFSSSATVYGEPDELPVRESSPIQRALSAYGNTKQIGEEIISDNALAKGLRAIALRYFNPVGAHDSGLLGELPIGKPNNLVPFITQTAIGKQPFLNVFGNNYNTPDGTCIRDYIHVMDVAAAHVAAVKRLIADHQKATYEVFNIGTGRGYSVKEVIAAFEKASGKALPVKMCDRRKGDIEKMYADTALSNAELNWKAEFGIDKMMESAWKWELNLSGLTKN